jgi:recombination protein RecT
MTRTKQLLHPQQTAVATRPAATVLLLRDTAAGLEVLMTRRSPTASFAPGVYVFPGGVVDAEDAQCHDLADTRASQDAALTTQCVAAIRESFEELGILLARHADGRMATMQDIVGMSRTAPFAAQCAERGLRLCADRVFWLAQWVTDREMRKRFDVNFLVARVPAEQTPVADEAEQFAPQWVRPQEALDLHMAGQFPIIFPTIRTLERLRAYATADDVLQACQSEQPLWHSCPRSGTLLGKQRHYMEHDAPFGELAMVSPDGQFQHTLDWQHAQAVPLLKNLLRLTAPNGGMMTGPGTNSYIVGDAHTGYAVIDPGPLDSGHIERLWQATGGDIRFIVCTHSHADHSPAAKPLQALCAQRNAIRGGGALMAALTPPILGLPSAATADERSHFVPDRALFDGEVLRLTASVPVSEVKQAVDMGQAINHAISQASHGHEREVISHSLQIIHTPGHAANHLCVILLEDGLLFSGDHILNGSTTVINPPDGHMGDYLASLDKLVAMCEPQHLAFILPAHGHVLGFAPQAIAQLKAHRLKREAKIAAVMQAHPSHSVDDWLALAYDDVSPQLWPVAKRSFLAHVAHIKGGSDAP